jgi:hypothetical protein
MTVYSRGFTQGSARFTANSFGPMYFKDDFSIYFSGSTAKNYVNNITVSCTPQQYYLSGREAQISCNIKNAGNKNYNSLEICIDGCVQTSLLINQQKTLTLDFSTGEGPQTKSVRIKDSGTTLSVTPFSYSAVDIAEGNISITPTTGSWPKIIVNANFTKAITANVYIVNNGTVLAQYNFQGTRFNKTISPGITGYDSTKNNITVAFQFKDMTGERTISTSRIITLNSGFNAKIHLYLSKAWSYMKKLIYQSSKKS